MRVHAARPLLGACRGEVWLIGATGNSLAFFMLRPDTASYRSMPRPEPPAQGFGDNGTVDLKENDDQPINLNEAEIGLQSAPVVAKDVVLIGAAFLDGAAPKSKQNVKGYVRAFDVRTGKRRWIFHTIPTKGEFGYDTWLNHSAEYTGNAGVWAQITVDEDLGLAYLPVELPTSDYYGGNRPGAGLFGESLVCVDLKTGKRKWHYQLVHHGMWDMDIPAAPILADIVVNGRTIKAVAQPTKQSILYVLDRVTGQPVWPIEERPVEKGDVPGEWYSPTQPFPTKPPAYDRNGISVDDLIDFTPELKAEALNLIKRYKIGPIFTPPSLSKAEGPLATLTLGTNNGGTNWAGRVVRSGKPHTVCVVVLFLRNSRSELCRCHRVTGTWATSAE